MKLADNDKRAIYEYVMSYFKDEVAKRLNEAIRARKTLE